MTKIFRKHLKEDEVLELGSYISVSCSSTYKGDEAPELSRNKFTYTCEFRKAETPPTEGLNPPDLIINGITNITARLTDDAVVSTYPSLENGRNTFYIASKRTLPLYCELEEPTVSQRQLFCTNSPAWISGQAVVERAKAMGREKELKMWEYGKKGLTLDDVELEEVEW